MAVDIIVDVMIGKLSEQARVINNAIKVDRIGQMPITADILPYRKDIAQLAVYFTSIGAFLEQEYSYLDNLYTEGLTREQRRSTSQEIRYAFESYARALFAYSYPDSKDRWAKRPTVYEGIETRKAYLELISLCFHICIPHINGHSAKPMCGLLKPMYETLIALMNSRFNVAEMPSMDNGFSIGFPISGSWLDSVEIKGKHVGNRFPAGYVELPHGERQIVIKAFKSADKIKEGDGLVVRDEVYSHADSLYMAKTDFSLNDHLPNTTVFAVRI